MFCVLALALAWFGTLFGGGAAFGAFWLMLFSFSAGVTWAGKTR